MFPRDRPGETLHPGVERIAGTLGIDLEPCLRHEGYWVRWGGTETFQRYGATDGEAWRGFHVSRADLDTRLLEHARRLGVTICQPASALAPRVAGGRVVGLHLRDGACIQARHVVDAAGGRHWLAHQVGLPIAPASRPLRAFYGYALGNLEDAAPRFEDDAQGWTWTSQVKPGMFQWTRLSFAGVTPPRHWMPARLQGLVAVAPRHGADVTWRQVRASAGPGYFIVGDAASVTDPSASHGVLKALMSGMMAGHLIAQHVNSGFDEHKLGNYFEHWQGQWFARDVTVLRDLYARLPNGRDVVSTRVRSAGPRVVGPTQN
jgi:flavin-dependent dehydrogenase